MHEDDAGFSPLDGRQSRLKGTSPILQHAGMGVWDSQANMPDGPQREKI